MWIKGIMLYPQRGGLPVPVRFRHRSGVTAASIRATKFGFKKTESRDALYVHHFRCADGGKRESDGNLVFGRSVW